MRTITRVIDAGEPIGDAPRERLQGTVDTYAVLTLMWPAWVAALFLVCFRAGAGEAGRGSAWRSRLAAGAAAGLVSVALVLVG